MCKIQQAGLQPVVVPKPAVQPPPAHQQPTCVQLIHHLVARRVAQQLAQVPPERLEQA